jgi:hypothetical protein
MYVASNLQDAEENLGETEVRDMLLLFVII